MKIENYIQSSVFYMCVHHNSIYNLPDNIEAVDGKHYKIIKVKIVRFIFDLDKGGRIVCTAEVQPINKQPKWVEDFYFENFSDVPIENLCDNKFGVDTSI